MNDGFFYPDVERRPLPKNKRRDALNRWMGASCLWKIGPGRLMSMGVILI